MLVSGRVIVLRYWDKHARQNLPAEPTQNKFAKHYVWGFMLVPPQGFICFWKGPVLPFSHTSLNTIPTQHHCQTRDCQQHTAKTKHKGRRDTVVCSPRARNLSFSSHQGECSVENIGWEPVAVSNVNFCSVHLWSLKASSSHDNQSPQEKLIFYN